MSSCEDTDVKSWDPLFIRSESCLGREAIYIGHMGRSLDHRLWEHHQALKNGDLGSSALAVHVFSLNHRVDQSIVINTHNHTQTQCMLESWHIQHHQSPLNRDRGTLPGPYAALLAWPYILLAFYYYCVINRCFAFPLRLVLGFTRQCPIIRFTLSPPTPFFLFCFLCINVLVKLAHVLLSVLIYLTWPHHHLTALLYLYMHACKCQLFTEEGSHRLPKHLNYCFSVWILLSG